MEVRLEGSQTGGGEGGGGEPAAERASCGVPMAVLTVAGAIPSPVSTCRPPLLTDGPPLFTACVTMARSWVWAIRCPRPVASVTGGESQPSPRHDRTRALAGRLHRVEGFPLLLALTTSSVRLCGCYCFLSVGNSGSVCSFLLLEEWVRV